ncbi:MAG: DMT family transporter [Cytophagaceae bacterium]|nr:DMT family transporter [Cytophagaceae bacterium]
MMKQMRMEKNNKFIVSENYRGVAGGLLIFTGAILFSCKAVLVKLAYQHEVDSVSLLILRMFFSLPFYIVILLVYNYKKPQPGIKGSDWLKIIFLGIVGYYLASYFDFQGLKFITAGLERLILFIYPTLVVLIASFVFKRPILKKHIIALLITYSGILLAVWNDAMSNQAHVLIGGGLIFLSALTYAMYLVGTEKLIPVLGTIPFTAYAMIVSTVAVLIHYLFQDYSKVFALEREVYMLGFIMAVFATVIPSFFISEGIRMIGSGTAAIIGSVGPVSTIILAYIFLGESITFTQVIGTLLVLAGVLIVSLDKNFISSVLSKFKS